jgi:hypothetical protein
MVPISTMHTGQSLPIAFRVGFSKGRRNSSQRDHPAATARIASGMWQKISAAILHVYKFPGEAARPDALEFTPSRNQTR